jgi:hypothetical protein
MTKTPRERTAAHYDALARRLKTESGATHRGAGTPQARTQAHYLKLARKLKKL